MQSADRQAGLLGCYCYNQWTNIRFGVSDIVFPDGSKKCHDWLKGYTLSNAIIYSTALLISLLNVVIIEVLELLSKFQKFHTRTQEKASNIVKMFLVQFINTGVVILIVNAKISSLSLPGFFPVFSGTFQDFTVEWYRVVGTTMMLTMLFNIVTPHLSSFCKLLFFGALRCFDRGCSCNARRTRKLLQEEYQDTYMGPEFLIEVRYSQIVSSFYILLLYSSGLPLLYFVGFVSFWLMYWIDKYLFVAFYKTPPRYGVELNEIARNMMQYGLVGHFILGFFMYSNSQIFA